MTTSPDPRPADPSPRVPLSETERRYKIGDREVLVKFQELCGPEKEWVAGIVGHGPAGYGDSAEAALADALVGYANDGDAQRAILAAVPALATERDFDRTLAEHLALVPDDDLEERLHPNLTIGQVRSALLAVLSTRHATWLAGRFPTPVPSAGEPYRCGACNRPEGFHHLTRCPTGRGRMVSRPSPRPAPSEGRGAETGLTEADWERIAFYVARPVTEPRRLLVAMTDSLATVTLDRDALRAALTAAEQDYEKATELAAGIIVQRDEAVTLAGEAVAMFDNVAMLPWRREQAESFRARLAKLTKEGT